MSADPMNGPHWAFSLTVYGMADVAPACLLLQDRCGVDVNVLLLSLYATTRLGLLIDQSRIEALDLSVAELRTQVIGPLRQIRRHMKTADYGAATQLARNKVKAAELGAEQLEQAALATLIASWPAESAAPATPQTVAEQVVLYYADSPIDDDIGAAIATIAGAAGTAR